MKDYCRLIAIVFAAFLLALPVAAQSSSSNLDLRAIHPVDRIQLPVDDSITVVRPGNRHPLARAEYDAGPAAADHRMDRMVLVLDADATQERALQALLAAQQAPVSPHYHHWLTPESFGELFGASQHDIDQVVSWLERQGFDVEPVSTARRSIVFSGTAAQVEAAFHTQIHVYDVNGERHYANATDPQIPAAFAAVVNGIASLHDFHSQPAHVNARRLGEPAPEYSNGATHYMAPVDFATIYDVNALYNTSINGAGQSIAIAGRTNFPATDPTGFRKTFGLSVNNPTVILNGPNPGIVSSNEQTEAELDVEWSGAVAPNAAIKFVLSGSTSTTDGVLLSSQYIVNNNVAPVMSLSFSLCEAQTGASQNQVWSNLWQQASVEGISVFVAAGDSGAAGCDSPSETTAVSGLAVNALCSPANSTCVGGTEFNDASNYSQYWSPTTNPATYGSALSYIPENVWNESGTAGGADLWSGGGGASNIYTKPAWQTGLGVPADGRRDVPDVSLSAASHDGYLFYMNGEVYVVGGTSAASPSFAGLMALVVQRAGAPQGCANSVLYGLANNQWNSGATVAIFHDVTIGNNSVPGQSGWNAGAGYDLASGLGSVDALQLVNNWSATPAPAPAGFRVTVATPSVTLTQGSNTKVQVNVNISGGFNSPVALSVTGLPSGLAASFSPSTISPPGSGSSTLTLTAASTLSSGPYSLTISAQAGGVTQTAPLSVTIQLNCTYSINPTSISTIAAGGGFTTAVTAPNGCSWSSSSAFSWLTFPANASGSGNGYVTFMVAANNTTSSRTGSLSIAGQTLTVTQAGSVPTVPVLNPSSASFTAVGGAGSTTLTLPQASTTWSVSSSVKWITITSPTTSKGNGTVTYLVAANTSSSPRSGYLTIAGIQFNVTQSGISCSYGVSLGAMTAAQGGVNGTAIVSTEAGCGWSATSNVSWITVTSGSQGTGPGTVGFFIANNPNSSPRSGNLTVAGWTIQVNEGAKGSARLGPPVL